MSGEYPFISYEELENAFYYEMTQDQQIGLLYIAAVQLTQYQEGRVPGNDLGLHPAEEMALTPEQFERAKSVITKRLFLALSVIGETPQFLNTAAWQRAVNGYSAWNIRGARSRELGKVFPQDAVDFLIALSNEALDTAIEL